MLFPCRAGDADVRLSASEGVVLACAAVIADTLGSGLIINARDKLPGRAGVAGRPGFGAIHREVLAGFTGGADGAAWIGLLAGRAGGAGSGLGRRADLSRFTVGAGFTGFARSAAISSGVLAGLAWGAC